MKATSYSTEQIDINHGYETIAITRDIDQISKVLGQNLSGINDFVEKVSSRRF